jgi:DNA invertase Pin-like site-specific DNA recombinase
LILNKHINIIKLEVKEGIDNMNIGYVRVSTIEQNEGRQIEALKKHNIDKLFTEKVSAKNTNRPELKAMIEFAREGDTIYIHSLDRLARSTKDLLEIVEELQAKGIHLVSNKENIDTNTATGKLMLTMIGAIAEFERANLLERQKEGIAIAKENGAYKGRKEIDFPTNWIEIYIKYKTRELTGTKAMEQLGLKRNTFYKLVKEHEEGK